MKKAILSFLFLTIALSASAQQTETKIDPKLELQIWLDRKAFSPGEIDGTVGKNTQKALSAFQETNKIPASANPADPAMLQALREEGVEPVMTYTITEADIKGPFVEKIPEDFMDKAKLKYLSYTSPLEALSEKFHTSPEILKKLNPNSNFSAGSNIQVPNVLVQKEQTPAQDKTIKPVAGKKQNPTASNTVVLSREKQQLMVKDGDGKTIFYAPITAGSDQYPYPVGVWKVNGVSKNPSFHYNPELFKDAKPNHRKVKLPPGPNNPVGTVWIDITAPHYGLHGTPEPGHIGYSESHGCIRLTNWDVEKLASLVKAGMPVVFE